MEFLWLSILSISVIKWSILSILIEKYWKHKKHNNSISQQTYHWLVQLWMEKKRVPLAKFVIIDFYRLLQLINRQLLSIIEYYWLFDYVLDDRFRSICDVLGEGQ